MIVNNYWNMRSYLDQTYFQDVDMSSNPGFFYDDIGIFDKNDVSRDFVTAVYFGNDYFSSAKWNSCIRKNLKVELGSGTTEPTAQDHDLETPVNLGTLQTTITTTADGTSEKTIVTVSGTNTTGASVTVSECGLFKSAYCKKTSAEEMEAVDIMFVHVLLDTPKTIANGESFTFTFEWSQS